MLNFIQINQFTKNFQEVFGSLLINITVHQLYLHELSILWNIHNTWQLVVVVSVLNEGKSWKLLF